MEMEMMAPMMLVERVHQVFVLFLYLVFLLGLNWNGLVCALLLWHLLCSEPIWLCAVAM